MNCISQTVRNIFIAVYLIVGENSLFDRRCNAYLILVFDIFSDNVDCSSLLALFGINVPLTSLRNH